MNLLHNLLCCLYHVTLIILYASPFISILGFSKELFSIRQHYKLLLLKVFLLLYKQLKVVRFSVDSGAAYRLWDSSVFDLSQLLIACLHYRGLFQTCLQLLK